MTWTSCGAHTPPIAEAPRAKSPKVLVTTTGNNSETRRTIRIAHREGGKKWVVMSMGPRKLPRLAAGDRLKVTAELQVTDDCRHPAPRCAGRPYRYSPRIGAKLVLARGRRTAGGKHAMPLSRRKEIGCRQSVPNRQHHCVIVFTVASLDVKRRGRLPCRPGSCHVNFVLDAHDRRARDGDRLVVGSNKPDGHILQDKGRINAIRLRPRNQPPPPVLETATRRDWIPLDQTPTVVLSRPLRGLKKNTQLAVLAKMRTDVSSLPYSARVTTHLILGRHRDSTSTSHRVAQIASLRGAIAETNGSNCTRAQTSCPYTKVGVFRMRRNATNRAGRPIPLYVNLYVISNPKRTKPLPGDRLKVLDGAKMKVARYRSSLRG